MYTYGKKCWREAASLIMLAKHNRGSLSRVSDSSVNYDILLQTRAGGASFPNSVVFPGGVTEDSDASDRWLRLFKTFGYTDRSFKTLHQQNSKLTPIFFENPIQRHIALRITAIRETFEELGILIGSRELIQNKNPNWASVITNIDLDYWREKVSKDPIEFLHLCEEYNCYPDIWSLYYWSNWLSPVDLEKRFDSAFFVARVQEKPLNIKGNIEVVDVKWQDPLETLERNRKKEHILFPPQTYELTRLSQYNNIDDLVDFAKHRSSLGNDLLYPVQLHCKDGKLHLLPGDDLYPSDLNYNKDTIYVKEKTVLELREGCLKLHRLEYTESGSHFILKNYKPNDHINMGDKVFPVYYM